jgi:N-acetylmuramoyl-L-alanine amidase
LRHDKFAVLKFAACPSVLIEGGYVSNDQEGRKLADPAYRERLAQAIAQGVDAYAGRVPVLTGSAESTSTLHP